MNLLKYCGHNLIYNLKLALLCTFSIIMYAIFGKRGERLFYINKRGVRNKWLQSCLEMPRNLHFCNRADRCSGQRGKDLKGMGVLCLRENTKPNRALISSDVEVSDAKVNPGLRVELDPIKWLIQ